MKKLLLLALLVKFSFITKAQWTTSGTYIYNTTVANNVGIGTSTSQPFKLSINGTASTDKKIGVNGTQVLYLPDQTSFTGSLSIGDGLGSLSHSSSSEGQYNTAIGLGSLTNITSGSFNTALGTLTLRLNTTGTNNVAFGHAALSANLTGTSNTGVGASALYVTTGSYNAAFGTSCLVGNTTGQFNTGVGSAALIGVTTGSGNTALGNSAGSNITTGGSNIAIGINTALASSTASNQMNIGNMIFGTGLTGSVTAPDGKIGIGTNAPGSSLDVKGILRLSGVTSGYVGLTVLASAGSTTYTLPGADGSMGQQLTTNGTGGLSWAAAASTTTNSLSLSGSNVTSTINGVTSNSITLPWSTSGANISNSNTGAVIIGSVSTPAGYKLYVSTGILTEKIKAALKTSANWSDYVFESNYKLKPIEEVEKYIKANKHLPDVPSADELVKEGGIDMNEMFATQMQKIEELTLYIIEMKKEIKDLQAQNARLNSSGSIVNQ